MLSNSQKHKIKHIFGDSKLVIDGLRVKLRKIWLKRLKSWYETAKLKSFEKSGGVIGHIPGETIRLTLASIVNPIKVMGLLLV